MDSNWVRIEPTPADQIEAGDLDGDGKGELIGMWPQDPGIWVKFSMTNTWKMVDPLKAAWFAVGKMRSDDLEAEALNLDLEIETESIPATKEPTGKTYLMPERFENLSSTGPSGAHFNPNWDQNHGQGRVVDPHWQQQIKPGPGEPGFRPKFEKDRNEKAQGRTSKKK